MDARVLTVNRNKSKRRKINRKTVLESSENKKHFKHELGEKC